MGGGKGIASLSIQNPFRSPKQDGTRIQKPLGTFWITLSAKRSQEVSVKKADYSYQKIFSEDNSVTAGYTWNLGQRYWIGVRRIIRMCATIHVKAHTTSFWVPRGEQHFMRVVSDCHVQETVITLRMSARGPQNYFFLSTVIPQQVKRTVRQKKESVIVNWLAAVRKPLNGQHHQLFSTGR